MTSVMSAKQARDNFSEMLGRVKYGDEVIRIEKKGKIFGVLISPNEYARFKMISQALLVKTSKELQKENRYISEEEVRKDIDSIVHKVREELYAGNKNN